MLDITDDAFEDQKSDTLCLIYSITEVRMGDYRGFLAIFKDKSTPKLILNITSYNIPKQKVFFDSTGNIIFIKAHIPNIHTEPFIIIDLENDRFSLVYDPVINERIPYTVDETSKHSFVIKPQNIKVKLSRLKYYPLSKINDIVRVRVKKRPLFGTALIPKFCNQ